MSVLIVLLYDFLILYYICLLSILIIQSMKDYNRLSKTTIVCSISLCIMYFKNAIVHPSQLKSIRLVLTTIRVVLRVVLSKYRLLLSFDSRRKKVRG